METARPMSDAPRSDRLTAFARAHPVLIILCLVLAQQVPLLDARHLWWSDEVRHGGVLADLRTQGDFWALRLNGLSYDDKPPLYFWYLAAVQEVVGPGAITFFAGLAGTVLAYALASWHLARRVLVDQTQALGAVAVLLSGSYFLGASHYARMDFLFATMILLAWGSFHAACGPTGLRARPVLAGFAAATLAAWVKGPVGVLLPLAALIGHLAHQRRMRDLASLPVLAGFGLLLAGIAVWAGGLVWFGGVERLLRLFDHQIVGRALDTHGGWLGYLNYAVIFPAVLLPFSLFALHPQVWRVGLDDGSRYVLICLVAGLLCLTLIGEKHAYYLIPLLPLAAILIVRASAALGGRKVLGVLAAWMAVQGGMALLAPWLLALIDPKASHLHPALSAAGLAGGVALAMAVALALWGRGRAPGWGRVLAAFVAAQTLFGGLLLGRVMPALDPVLSPAALAGLMRPAMDQGYAPAVAHGIQGVFAYDLGQHYTALTSEQAIIDWLAVTPRGVLALELPEWQAIAARVPAAQTLGCTGFVGLGFVVLAFPPGVDAAPPASGNGCPDP